MTEVFKGDFLDTEKQAIRAWIQHNQPKIPQNVSINGIEYVIAFVFEDDGRIAGFQVTKLA